MIKEIFRAIAARTGFVPGTTLHLGRRPQDAADRCVLVAFNAGGGVVFDLPDRMDVMVQILARAKDYNDAYADSMTAFNALHGVAAIALPVLVSGQAWVAMTIEAVNAPQFIGMDEKGRCEFSTNYIWRIKDCAK
jgi:hypothetical protein